VKILLLAVLIVFAEVEIDIPRSFAAPYTASVTELAPSVGEPPDTPALAEGSNSVTEGDDPTPTPTPPEQQQAAVYVYELPSGGQAIYRLEATAGDVAIISLLLALITLSGFNVVQRMARAGSVR